MRQEQQQAVQAFIGSAGMLLGILKPDLSDDERSDLVIASLEKRAEEQATQ
jgi:hypothetical protein